MMLTYRWQSTTQQSFMSQTTMMRNPMMNDSKQPQLTLHLSVNIKHCIYNEKFSQVSHRLGIFHCSRFRTHVCMCYNMHDASVSEFTEVNGERGARAYNVGLGRSPQRGLGAETLVKWLGGNATLKLRGI